ncbi:MAG TPA: SPOR domain-containing protein [Steroidobacteraceae bacterium]|nr:SPOR domain-containing protein [Steroidobacteraceae bacterium]
MSRDYKGSRGRSGSGLSGGAGLLLGLAIGLGVAAALYIYDRRPGAQAPAKPEASARTDRNARASAEEEPAEDSGQKYDFYQMLPKFEVVVPEREKAEAADAKPAPIERPGAYVLQAGSYRNYADADRVRAQLALLGVESKVQKVSVDNDTWHRVRIGPIEDLKELNRTRDRLRQADIDALVIRVGD